MKITSLAFRTLFIPLALFASFSCKKNNGDGVNSESNLNYTPITSPELTTTQLAVYVAGNDQVSNPLYMFGYYGDQSYGPSYQPAFGYFYAGPQTVDKYLSHLGIQSTLTFSGEPVQYKGFNAGGSSKDYVNFRYSHYVNVGNVANLGGATTLTLPGNGSIEFPDMAFDGSGIAMNYSFLVNYLDPSVPEFALDQPSLPFADEKGRRWFLESYGIYQINPILTYCNCNIISPAIRYEKEVVLRMPIPANRIAAAPDSIETWHFTFDAGGLTHANNLYWQKNGMAYKRNGAYETKTRDFGALNFAKPTDAVYVTLQLRTTNDISLTNTRFVVKNSNTEITEGRTDMDGNALVLLPTDENLYFNIINDHFLNYSGIQTPDQNIGSFSRPATKKVVLPDRIDVGTLEANVYNCDGSSFGNGFVLISQLDAKDNYIVPVLNGAFKTANWLNVAYSFSTLTFMHTGGDTAFKINTCLGSPFIKNVKRLQENFYSCPDANYLYCNFQIDGQSQTFSGSMDQPSPILTAKPGPGNTAITMTDGTKGISFAMWILGDNFGHFSGGAPIMVNGIACQYGADPELTIYRNDNVPNGIMEGWFAVDYLDSNSKPHKMSGNFRIKISS
jgi:hypothetical protein